ncbi:MAG: DUF819 family protein [Bacteroidetes bacterium]|jgi:uncharacterized membrane protein|nr:DUF819 family protein [Bacteroidota bacterium]
MSEVLWPILQIATIAFFPFLSRRMAHNGWLPAWLSPVVLCYAVGMLIRNLALFPLDDNLSTTATEAAILFAIPLLLYATDLGRWLKYARGSLLSFGLCVLSGLAATSVTAVVFWAEVESPWQLAGMLTGIYTGGTPNMQAIGLALSATQERIIVVNAADVLMGGVYLLLLTSFLPALFGKILPAFLPADGQTDEALPESPYNNFNYRDALKAILLTLAVIGSALGATWLVYETLSEVAFLILMLTTLSLIAALSPRVRQWEHTFETGEYFLLMFCVALGMLADFGQMADAGLGILGFTAVAFVGTILLHLLLAALFRIDRDTFLFTSVAALYGPPFIGQMASITNNRQLIFSGIAMGLLGYAIGNYLGIGWAYLLQMIGSTLS